jgi:hypothetical protein
LQRKRLVFWILILHPGNLLTSNIGSKFSVTYDSLQKLKSGEVTELPSHHTAYPYFPKPILQSVFSKFGLYVIEGLFDMPEERSLNKRYPEIKTKTVRECISAWKGK